MLVQFQHINPSRKYERSTTGFSSIIAFITYVCWVTTLSIILAISSLKQRPGNDLLVLTNAVTANVSVHYSFSTTNLSDVLVTVKGPDFVEYLSETLDVNGCPLVTHTQICNQTYQTLDFEPVRVISWKYSALVTFVILSLLYLDGMLYVLCINRSGHVKFLLLAARLHGLAFLMAVGIMLVAHFRYDTLFLLSPYYAFMVYLSLMCSLHETAVHYTYFNSPGSNKDSGPTSGRGRCNFVAFIKASFRSWCRRDSTPDKKPNCSDAPSDGARSEKSNSLVALISSLWNWWRQPKRKQDEEELAGGPTDANKERVNERTRDAISSSHDPRKELKNKQAMCEFRDNFDKLMQCNSLVGQPSSSHSVHTSESDHLSEVSDNGEGSGIKARKKAIHDAAKLVKRRSLL